MIGGGPGGYAAALYGALAGPRIAVVERDKVGGVCLHPPQPIAASTSAEPTCAWPVQGPPPRPAGPSTG